MVGDEQHSLPKVSSGNHVGHDYVNFNVGLRSSVWPQGRTDELGKYGAAEARRVLGQHWAGLTLSCQFNLVKCSYTLRKGPDRPLCSPAKILVTMDGFGEEPPADLIIEAIDGELYGPKQPKVILFDIGGVCVSHFPTQSPKYLQCGL